MLRDLRQIEDFLITTHLLFAILCFGLKLEEESDGEIQRSMLENPREMGKSVGFPPVKLRKDDKRKAVGGAIDYNWWEFGGVGSSLVDGIVETWNLKAYQLPCCFLLLPQIKIGYCSSRDCLIGLYMVMNKMLLAQIFILFLYWQIKKKLGINFS